MNMIRRLFLPLGVLAALVSLHAAEPGAYSRAVTVTPLLKTRTDGAGNPLVYPTHAAAEVIAVHVELAPGQQTNWHKHPVPCFAYVLEGDLEVELPDGTVKKFKAGDAVAEVVNLLHNGRNPGKTPVKLVLFAIGTVNQPYAVKADTPAVAGKE